MGLCCNHLAGVTGWAASCWSQPCGHFCVAASAVLMLSFPFLLSLWGVRERNTDNGALPHGLQARTQTFSVFTGGLFPLTPPLKSARPTPEEADVIGGWEAVATLGQFPPSEEGNSSGQCCLSVVSQRTGPRNDVAF